MNPMLAISDLMLALKLPGFLVAAVLTFVLCFTLFLRCSAWRKCWDLHRG